MIYKKIIKFLSFLTFSNSLLHTQSMPQMDPPFLQNGTEKKIVVIIPSFNNESSYVTNLTSVLSQEYDNYHIIYIDDASTDRTGQLVKQFIKDNQLEDRITLIQNDYNRKALANMYKAVHLCEPTDLILELDGDDALADNQILRKINELFSTQDIWFAYAQYKNVPVEKAKENKISILGYTKPTPELLIESREFRNKWLWSGLRMYYAWLFQQIKLEDLILPCAPYSGKFFPTSKDGACAYPMLEMSGYKIKHIPDIWLLRNIDTPLNDYKIAKDLQMHCGATLKQSPKYDRLEHPIYHKSTSNAAADIVILSDDNSIAQLQQAIASFYTYAKGIGNIYLLFRKNSEIYGNLKTMFPELFFIQCPDNKNIRSTLSDALTNMNDYLIFSNGNCCLKEPVNLSSCIKLLNSTYAYAFYLKPKLAIFGDTAHKNLLPCEQIIDDIYAWKFNCIPSQQIPIHNLELTMYRTKDILISLKNINIETIKDFQEQWKNYSEYSTKIGLFFEQGKIV